MRMSQRNMSIRSSPGAVRTYKLLCDGRRQLGTFPGDVFGLESSTKHRPAAEAISGLRNSYWKWIDGSLSLA